jgi:glycosyltransferase involved in cell wall biosynthesis
VSALGGVLCKLEIMHQAVFASPSPAASDPFVSIVTVSLNAGESIEDALLSVSMQRRDFRLEHVCVDGGSTDGTRDIVDRWAIKSGHINRIYGPDEGIFDAMNKGLRAARGEYVMFLNADDFLAAPDSLAQALAGLSPCAPDNPDLIVGNVVMGNLHSRGFWRHRRVPRLLKKVRGCGLYPLHQAMLAKRRLLNAVGGFNPRLRLAADVNQYYDMERRFGLKMRFVNEDMAFMRAGGAANAGPGAMWIGTTEIYRHLRPTHGAVRSALMVSIKTIQSISEVRWGRTPHLRWFAGQ